MAGQAPVRAQPPLCLQYASKSDIGVINDIQKQKNSQARTLVMGVDLIRFCSLF